MRNLVDLTSSIFTVLRVLGSTIEGPHKAVMVGGEGLGGFGDDEPPEKPDGIEAYGAPGIVWRPRVAETVGKDRFVAEAFSARVAEGLVPLSWRDLRWHKAFPAPQPGTTAFVGYAGGSASWDDVDMDATSGSGAVKNQRFTLYVPYAKDSSGTPTKAHAIVADPESEALMLVHGDGYAFVLDKDNGVTMRSKTGSSWMNLKDNAFEVVANTITLRGNCALGANTAAALPLLPGPASQPTPSVFFSPV